ncbi:MAG: Hsp20/alpha crystallin family protein [Deltaproteobacteria bacterium]|nr:Hsp20/alpha crystallin family protein [Deltaproteobacteria bacterium]MCW5803615.1 Hsp20/alpha crystallin family protein [Deltaproteobacteria bacterium]
MAAKLLERWIQSLANKTAKRVPPPRSVADGWTPHFEVRQGHRSIRFIGDLPGVQREDIQICIAGHRLIVTGHRAPCAGAAGELAPTRERGYGNFTRYFELPETVELDGITTDLSDGVLTIVAPMTHRSRVRTIPVLDAR